jgi:hypothetical protein
VTFRTAPDGSLVEEVLYRNLHPMLGKRLDLWRLANFALVRLASPEDVYLFSGVAHDNPKDHRLFALAEVRDLVPVTRHQDWCRQLSATRPDRPAALAAMRSALASYPPRETAGGEPARPVGATAVDHPQFATAEPGGVLRAAGSSGRVVRPVGRCPHRHGLGHREHGLDREGTQADHRVHPGRGEINVVVAGINVGGQPYWNAEATMLMHTKGILVMTPDSAMVLTGKQSLDFSGGVSAEDNFGIGGYDRVMGPNGQAQYWAKDLVQDAYGILLAHYDYTWVAPGESGPRRRPDERPARP